MLTSLVLDQSEIRICAILVAINDVTRRDRLYTLRATLYRVRKVWHGPSTKLTKTRQHRNSGHDFWTNHCVVEHNSDVSSIPTSLSYLSSIRYVVGLLSVSNHRSIIIVLFQTACAVSKLSITSQLSSQCGWKLRCLSCSLYIKQRFAWLDYLLGN